jgi:hypothetical protein
MVLGLKVKTKDENHNLQHPIRGVELIFLGFIAGVKTGVWAFRRRFIENLIKEFCKRDYDVK